MFEKIFYFDLAKLNWKGWLLFLITCAMFVGAAFLIAMEAEPAADAILENRGTKKIFGYVAIGASAAFFVGVRIILEKIGISIHKKDDTDSDTSN